MVQASRWTDGLDSKLLSLRAAGLPWDSIAMEMEMSRSSVRERGRRLGAFAVPARRPRVAADARDRPPRCPGHPECWRLITDGTVLEGQPYPYPVFL
jgi:hypothetical protein